MKNLLGLTDEDFAELGRKREGWWRKVEAGMPRCQYGNEGGPCMTAPEENGWCRMHQHIPAIRARWADAEWGKS